MPGRSLRVRFAVSIAAIALVVSAGISVAVSAITSADLTTNARSTERTRVELAASLYARTGQVVVGAVRDDIGAPPALRAAVARGLLGTDRTARALWAGTPLPGGHGIYVEDGTTGNAHTLASLRRTLVLVSLVATLLAAGVGTLLSVRLSRRLGRAAGIADRVAAGDLAARVDATGADEVARLGHAIDAMTAALSVRIDRERRFAADVAHELRTPLTALVTAGDLLDDSRPAQIVREGVNELRTLVEDLLEIFRLEAGNERLSVEPVELGRLVERLAVARGAGPRDLILDTARAGRVETDRRRLERILANLLDNALRHGQPPATLTVDGTTLTVADAGDGFPEELLRDGPAPFRTHTAARGTGTGLGLTIAQAQAVLLGARLTLANDTEGGALATLELPPVPPLV